eukprot:514180_1
MNNQNIYKKLQEIIKNDGYDISLQLVKQIETNCNLRKNTKLPLVGLCHHCCADGKNITSVPAPSFASEIHRYRHKCLQNCNNGKGCDVCKENAVTCGFFICRKEETFIQYVDRVYHEYFGNENENKEDTNDKHIMDVGEIFFKTQTKIETGERQKIFGTVILADWYKSLEHRHRVHIEKCEQYLYSKYGTNKEIYCYHLSLIFWESNLISVCNEYFKHISENQDTDMENVEDIQKKNIEKFSELFSNKEQLLTNLYNVFKDILKIGTIDTSMSDENYNVVDVKKFRTSTLLANSVFEKRDQMCNYIKTSYSKDSNLKSFMLQKEQLYFDLFKTNKNLYIFAIAASLIQGEMHKLYDNIIREESADKLQISYFNYIQNMSMKISKKIVQLHSFLWPVSNTNNKRKLESNIEGNNNFEMLSTPTLKKAKTDVNRKYYLEPNAYKLLKQLILHMPDESESSYRNVMREIYLPLPVIEKMRENLKQKGYKMSNQIKTETQIKYHHLSPRTCLFDFDFNLM